MIGPPDSIGNLQIVRWSQAFAELLFMLVPIALEPATYNLYDTRYVVGSTTCSLPVG
jgi:hypothetical protein